MPGTTDLLRVGTDQVPWEIRLSRRRRTLSIRCIRSHESSSAPRQLAPVAHRGALAERVSWIIATCNASGACGLPAAPPSFVTGDLLSYVGELHR